MTPRCVPIVACAPCPACRPPRAPRRARLWPRRWRSMPWSLAEYCSLQQRAAPASGPSGHRGRRVPACARVGPAWTAEFRDRDGHRIPGPATAHRTPGDGPQNSVTSTRSGETCSWANCRRQPPKIKGCFDDGKPQRVFRASCVIRPRFVAPPGAERSTSEGGGRGGGTEISVAGVRCLRGLRLTARDPTLRCPDVGDIGAGAIAGPTTRCRRSGHHLTPPPSFRLENLRPAHLGLPLQQ
jgi:hypothetical protein